MSETRRVRITSDGTTRRTKAIDVETGATYPAVSLAWELASYEDFPVATLKVIYSEFDVEAEARIFRVCSKCGDEDATKELDDLRASLALEKEWRLVVEDRLRDMGAKLAAAIAENAQLKADASKARATMGGLVSLLGWRGTRS